MAEINQDESVVSKEFDKLFKAPERAKLALASHIVYVEPETKMYKILLGIAQAFTIASLIAWFVLLVLLIILVFSMMNNLEVLTVMRDQQAFFEQSQFHRNQ